MYDGIKDYISVSLAVLYSTLGSAGSNYFLFLSVFLLMGLTIPPPHNYHKDDDKGKRRMVNSKITAMMMPVHTKE